MHSQLYEGSEKALQKDDGAEWKLVVVASRRSAPATSQRAERRSSRHQVGSCEDRASNYFEKEGKSFWAGHRNLLTGIQVV